jgi:acyl-CoA synthetase (AMP-forming)/AMP-acid ligase II
MLVSAAPISDETALQKPVRFFCNATYQGYGQTELLPVAIMGPRQWFAADVPRSQPMRACSLPLPLRRDSNLG